MLGAPKHILAPMVAQSDLPFRLMCEHLYNVDLSYTQMIHAYNFAESNGEVFRKHHLDVYPQSLIRNVLLGRADRDEIVLSKSQQNALVGLSENDVDSARRRILHAINPKQECIDVKPTIVQIAAHDPKVAVEAALLILERSASSANGNASPVAAIDLNLGCPQAIARKGKYGAFLHDEFPETAYSVLKALRSSLPNEIGVTAKVRLPPTRSDVNAGRLGPKAEMPPTPEQRVERLIDCGVDLITVHGRSRFENKVAVGACNWGAIQQSVAAARAYSDDYPIFANGGIEMFSDVENCLQQTAASGVMSSESLLENPGLFCKNIGSQPETAKGLLERQLSYADIYLDYATLFPPLPGSLGTQGGSFNVIRSHLFKFLHRYFEEQSDLRLNLGDNEFNNIKEARELVSEMRRRYDNLDEHQLLSKSSSSIDSSWYRRHRNSDAKNASTSEHNAIISTEEKKQLAKNRIMNMRKQRMERDSKQKLTL
ncbi:hypothetical protein ACHAXN_006304 [Cyclotella atomus]